MEAVFHGGQTHRSSSSPFSLRVPGATFIPLWAHWPHGMFSRFFVFPAELDVSRAQLAKRAT